MRASLPGIFYQSISIMKLQSLALLSSVALVSANWAKNLNYRSPSDHHPSLGISIHKVVKRNDPSSAWDPAKLNFTPAWLLVIPIQTA